MVAVQAIGLLSKHISLTFYSVFYTRTTGPGEESGFGFELTLRLKTQDEGDPPMWPATLLNSLARYVFQTGQ